MSNLMFDRLRDNPGEVYQFRERVTFDTTEDETQPTNDNLSPQQSRRRPPRQNYNPYADSEDLSLIPAGASTVRTSSDSPEDDYLPNGVFTLLTECYSPTCTRDKLCYSIACPRRLEQIARLNLKVQTGLKNEQSTADVVDDVVAEVFGGERRLWINSVSREVWEGVGERERKRQENINEAIYTERDFVKDIEYLRDVLPLPATTHIVPLPVFVNRVLFIVLDTPAE
jgi:RHO1 GDP-GTP exchange protein 1/2